MGGARTGAGPQQFTSASRDFPVLFRRAVRLSGVDVRPDTAGANGREVSGIRTRKMDGSAATAWWVQARRAHAGFEGGSVHDADADGRH